MSMKSKKKQRQKGENELILTPGGWRQKSKVYKIEPGQHIDGRNGYLKIVDTKTGKIIKDLGEIPEAAASKMEKHDSGIDRTEIQKKQRKSITEEKDD